MRNRNQHYLNVMVRSTGLCSWTWGSCLHQQDEADICKILKARQPKASSYGQFKAGLWNILYNIDQWHKAMG